MKKILCILFCLLPVLGGKAQAFYRDQVRIEKESITRNEDNNVLNIDMDIAMQENLEPSSSHAVTLTPFLESNGHAKMLPSIVVYGREREVVNQCSNIAPSRNTYSVTRHKHNKEQTINYYQQFQFEARMCDAEMKLNIDACGCCDLKEETSDELITQLNILPVQLQSAMSYITPQAEAVRHRVIEGSAFLDFSVNQIIIQSEYRRNTVELAKIRTTTNNVRNDDKTTLSSIGIRSYASPEGGYANDTRLAKDRTQTLVDYVTSYYKFDNKLVTLEHTSEDWEGFRKFIAVSSLEKKDEIPKLMDDLTLDIDKKERQIAQLAGFQTYKYILEKCYPALCRSDYTVNYTVRGFNLEETKEIIKIRPQLLSLQEIYRIAENCQSESEEFNRSLQVAVATFLDDPIANLNAGAMETQKGGDLTIAKKHLAKADQKTPGTLNNLGVVALLEGDYDAVEEYFNAVKAGGLAIQADTNMKQLKSIRSYPKE